MTNKSISRLQAQRGTLRGELTFKMHTHNATQCSMYAKKGMQVVLFERRLVTRGAQHTHVQVVPVPEAKAAEVRDAFEVRGRGVHKNSQARQAAHGLMRLPREGEARVATRSPPTHSLLITQRDRKMRCQPAHQRNLPTIYLYLYLYLCM